MKAGSLVASLLAKGLAGCVVSLTLPAASQTPAASIAPVHGAKSAEGAKLFDGDEALKGRLQGMSFELDASAVRCKNCHTVTAQAVIPGSSAPALTAGMLTSELKRRSGPPSHYTLESFCKLLRTGIDPAYVIVNRQMPRFEIDEEQCGSIWSYLTLPGGS